mmetsp:Transcript_21773/g.64872  ORF Transcript_21773/g.64872 Transcript_21773/m.64872 type:complete len:213 (-) Transcript_21773:980-1618(-)
MSPCPEAHKPPMARSTEDLPMPLGPLRINESPTLNSKERSATKGACPHGGRNVKASMRKSMQPGAADADTGSSSRPMHCSCGASNGDGSCWSSDMPLKPPDCRSRLSRASASCRTRIAWAPMLVIPSIWFTNCSKARSNVPSTIAALVRLPKSRSPRKYLSATMAYGNTPISRLMPANSDSSETERTSFQYKVRINSAKYCKQRDCSNIAPL